MFLKNSLNFFVFNDWIMVLNFFCGGTTMGSRDDYKYDVVNSEIL